MKCVLCGHGRTKRSSEKQRFSIGKILFVGAVPVQVCPKCNESYATSEAQADFERRIAAHLAANGPATGETFRFMRKAVGISAREAASLLQLAHETISRWENGARPVDFPAWAALSALVLDELHGSHKQRDRMRRLQKKPPAKTKPINLDAISAR